MGFTRSGLTICKNSSIESVKTSIDYWLTNFSINVTVVLILREYSVILETLLFALIFGSNLLILV